MKYSMLLVIGLFTGIFGAPLNVIRQGTAEVT
ncbi:hypothetical protein HYALB_00013341 [Hymenoscyphus albidus]|uniref:Uncharacterized protein n=1 Tax=Hymenoscyphus albidus TaxID=595503 RepID=A0A9N9LV30_9HELO|nr:hypothetical protein HYALB_00013341 [Hymenoscyphus albidus]